MIEESPPPVDLTPEDRDLVEPQVEAPSQGSVPASEPQSHETVSELDPQPTTEPLVTMPTELPETSEIPSVPALDQAHPPAPDSNPGAVIPVISPPVSTSPVVIAPSVPVTPQFDLFSLFDRDPRKSSRGGHSHEHNHDHHHSHEHGHHSHEHHSHEHNPHGNPWHSHHSSEDNDWGRRGYGRGRGGSWLRYLLGGRGGGGGYGGGGGGWSQYVSGDDHGCDLTDVLLGLRGCGNTPGTKNNNIDPSGSHGWQGNSDHAGSSGSGPWWQQRLGDSGSQKVPNPLPPESFGSQGSGSSGSGSGSFGSGSGSLGSGSGSGIGGFGGPVNLPKGMGSFDEPGSVSPAGTSTFPQFDGSKLSQPKGSGSFDDSTSTFGTGVGIKEPIGSSGSGGLRDSSSFGDLSQASSTSLGTGGSGGLKNPDTIGFGGTGGLKEPSSFDWNKWGRFGVPANQNKPMTTSVMEKTVPCKSSEFVGFSNGHMKFLCDCGDAGINYQEEQCVTKAPGLRAPVISRNLQQPDQTFAWLNGG